MVPSVRQLLANGPYRRYLVFKVPMQGGVRGCKGCKGCKGPYRRYLVFKVPM